jgi:hypothetical protein
MMTYPDETSTDPISFFFLSNKESDAIGKFRELERARHWRENKPYG